MADRLKKTQDKLKRVIAHLGGCRTCRCKTAADLQVIDDNLREIANVLRNCRDIEDRMLREGCGKEPKPPCQEFDNTKSQPCTKKSRVYIRWNK